MPSELGILKGLAVLDLHDNPRMGGSIPLELAQLAALPTNETVSSMPPSSTTGGGRPGPPLAESSGPQQGGGGGNSGEQGRPQGDGGGGIGAGASSLDSLPRAGSSNLGQPGGLPPQEDSGGGGSQGGQSSQGGVGNPGQQDGAAPQGGGGRPPKFMTFEQVKELVSLQVFDVKGTDITGSLPLRFCHASMKSLFFDCSSTLCGCECPCGDG